LFERIEDLRHDRVNKNKTGVDRLVISLCIRVGLNKLQQDCAREKERGCECTSDWLKSGVCRYY
jgi:hypothetical protein